MGKLKVRQRLGFCAGQKLLRGSQNSVRVTKRKSLYKM